MIVINGTVSDEVKEHLRSGCSHPVAHRHGNLILAGRPTKILGKAVDIIIKGTETFTFQAANNTLYYKNSDFVSIPHDDIVFASCTHFKWGDGGVIADMKDGEFIFNYTKSSGIGTGNISFKNDALFTSASAAKEWFKAQYDKGDPVIVTAYVKE